MQPSLRMELSTHGGEAVMADWDMVSEKEHICVHVFKCIFAGNLEDKTVPTYVKALKDHKIVGVSCGSGDSHTIALEDNGRVDSNACVHVHVHYMYM